MLNLVQILAGLGLITVLLAFLKRTGERRRWRNFKANVDDWVDRLVETENRHPNQLTEDQWKAECERILTDARFSPLAITQMLDTAVMVAKGIAADKVFM